MTIENFPTGKYKVVVIDPPWPVIPLNYKRGGNRWRRFDYSLMTVHDIVSLPIPEILEDDAFVFLWTPNRFVGTAIDIVNAWGTKYNCLFTWVKPHGVQVPNHPQFNAEWVVMGRKGSPQFNTTKAFKTANFWPRGKHSEKPEGFYELLRRVTPEPRIDLFARRRIEGFDSWGNEVE